MRNQTIFEGIATALVTPMDANGNIDYEAFGRLIDWQIEQGINALVICGTTGEGSTLSDEEHKEVMRYGVERIAGRVPAICGTGSNDTAYGIQLSQYACEIGADALLVVTPYYNKATQKGLVKLYQEYSDAVDKPIIVYNVPSRTGVNIEPATYVELAKIENVCAIKEANSNISKITTTMSLLDDAVDVYSGNDDQIVPLLSVGAKGCISVLSNVVPAETVAITDLWRAGDIQGSLAMQLKMMELVGALFCEVNPIPVKAAMAAMGYGENVLRSPLYPMEDANYARLMAAMKELGVL